VTNPATVGFVRHRWPPLRPRPVAPVDEPDDAAAALSRVVQNVRDRVSRVLKSVTSVCAAPVAKRNYEDRAGVEDRAWRFAYKNIEAYCVLDAAQERALLSLVVGGAPAGRLSEIERRIVAEVVAQLLEGVAAEQLREELRLRPPSPAWACDLQLRGAGELLSTIVLFTACRAAPPPRIVRPCLDGVPLSLRAMLSPRSCELGRIASWDRGTLVRLGRGHHVKDVLLYAGPMRLARGELGSLEGERAVLITDILRAWT
jgi:hypothetical protein